MSSNLESFFPSALILGKELSLLNFSPFPPLASSPCLSSVMKLPSVLIPEIFSFFTINERSRSLSISRGLNAALSSNVVTHCVLSSESGLLLGFNDSVAKRFISERNFYSIRAIDLRVAGIFKLSDLFTERMPCLRSLVIPEVLKEPVIDLLNFSCFNLTSLDFSRNQVAMENLSRMVLPHLRHLNVQSYKITEENLVSLAKNSPQIQSLSLEDCSMSTKALAKLAFAHLKYLNLSDREKALDLSTIHSPKLECLEMVGRKKIKGLASFVLKHPRIHSLNFESAEIKPEELSELIHLKTLTRLDFNSNGASHKQVEVIGRSCLYLHSLNLSNRKSFYDSKITDKELRLCAFPELTSLNLSCCRLISAEALKCISKKFPKLEILDLSMEEEKDLQDHDERLIELTPCDLTSLVLPELIVLNCNGREKLPHLSSQVFEKLRQNCPKLKLYSI